MRFFLPLLFFCCLFAASIRGELKAPWLATSFELQPTLKAKSYFYKKGNRSAVDFLGVAEGSLALLDLFDISVEAEGVSSNRFPSGYTAASFAGRYLLLNDAVGDPLCCTAGFQLRHAASKGLSNYSLFYHNHLECEVHVAIGKELDNKLRCPFWRWWSAASGGWAARAAPWIKCKGAVEKIWPTGHHICLELFSEKGLGSRGFNRKDFYGYKKINYCRVEGAVGYSYRFDSYAECSLLCAYRFYAHNCPRGAVLTLSCCLPFGL